MKRKYTILPFGKKEKRIKVVLCRKPMAQGLNGMVRGKGLPHEQEKLTAALHKTALGAEQTVSGTYFKNINEAISYYKKQGYEIYALEQADNSCNLANTSELEKNTVLILGEEVHGIDADILKKCNKILEIPMFGTKESFNVSVATAMALYELKRSDLKKAN